MAKTGKVKTKLRKKRDRGSQSGDCPSPPPSPVVEVSPEEARDEAVLAATDEFLKGSGCFNCPKLKARISHATCVERQQRQQKKGRYFGRIVTMNANPLDRYCSSGECGLGKFVARTLAKIEAAQPKKEDEKKQ